MRFRMRPASVIASSPCRLRARESRLTRTSTTRSNCVSTRPVRVRMRFDNCACSRLSLSHRSDHRACCSRSGQPRARYREFLLNPAFFGVSEMTARSLPFQLTDCCSQSSVLDEISEVTEHRFRKSCQRFLLFSRRAGEAYHGAIGLELRKRQLKHLAGAFPPKFFDEVDGHVVAGAETGGEGVAAPRRERG